MRAFCSVSKPRGISCYTCVHPPTFEKKTVLFNIQVPTPLAYFSSLVQSDEGFPLLEAAISLGQDEAPDLDIQAVLAEVDLLQARLAARCLPSHSVLERIHLLNRYFFQDLGFGVNANDYYDPDNSFIHQVLRTRRGIPISIGVLWLELARSLDLNAYGVSFPGHFMLKVVMAQGQVMLDPLTGRSFSSTELTEQLQTIMPRLRSMDEDSVPLGVFIHSAQPREIIARMLRNLKEIYRVQQDHARQLAVQNRLVVLLPSESSELRDRAWIHADLGQLPEAIADLQQYLALAREPVDKDEVTATLRQWHKRL